MELELEKLDNSESISEVLKLVDTRFRATSSLLKRIIVGAYDDDPSSFHNGNGESWMDNQSNRI
jgi:hypothetical protein